MSWLVRVRVPLAEIDIVSADLWARGTDGIAEMTDAAGGIELVAGFTTEAMARSVAAALLDQGRFDAHVEAVEPWPTPPPTQIDHDGVQLRIDAGPAFGHGAHPTTSMALELVVRAAHGHTVLDVGCGTGILAIAAAKAGAASVLAIDHDPDALVSARRNADDNGVEIEISGTAVATLDQQFSLIVANLLAADLRPVASAVRAALTDDATLILTGFLIEQSDEVRSWFDDLDLVDRLRRDGWDALVLGTPARSSAPRHP